MDALIFDAYGTLFDVSGLASVCEATWPGRGEAVSSAWRLKQLEYSWLRTLTGQYIDFEILTADALRFTCDSLSARCTQDDVDRLLREYRHLNMFGDTVAALRSMSGIRLVILSNGSRSMLEALVRNSGLWELFEAVLSVDVVRLFKPHPRVYQLAADTLQLDVARIGFVSANGWDACGARCFGFPTFWINRDAAPIPRLGVEPDHILSSLAELPLPTAW